LIVEDVAAASGAVFGEADKDLFTRAQLFMQVGIR